MKYPPKQDYFPIKRLPPRLTSREASMLLGDARWDLPVTLCVSGGWVQAQHDTQLKSHSSGVLMPELPHATGSRAAEGLDPPQDKGLNPKGLPRLCCSVPAARWPWRKRWWIWEGSRSCCLLSLHCPEPSPGGSAHVENTSWLHPTWAPWWSTRVTRARGHGFIAAAIRPLFGAGQGLRPGGSRPHPPPSTFWFSKGWLLERLQN